MQAQRDGTVGKGLCCQARGPELHPSDPRGERSKLTPLMGHGAYVCAHAEGARVDTHTQINALNKCKGKYEILFKLTLSEAGEWPYVPSVSPWGCPHRPMQGGLSTNAIGHYYWLQSTFCDNAIYFSICVWDVCDFFMIENVQATKQSTNPDLLSHKAGASRLLVSQSSSSYLSQCLETLGFSSAVGPASASFSSVT